MKGEVESFPDLVLNWKIINPCIILSNEKYNGRYISTYYWRNIILPFRTAMCLYYFAQWKDYILLMDIESSHESPVIF